MLKKHNLLIQKYNFTGVYWFRFNILVMLGMWKMMVGFLKKSIKNLNAEDNVIAYDFNYDEVAVAA